MSLDAAELRAYWRGVIQHFRAWSLPIDLLFDPSSYRMWGADLMPGVLDGRRARAAAQALAGASPEMLEALTAMAKVNAARSGDVFKGIAVGYVTLPLAFAALLSDAAPNEVRAFLAAHGDSVGIFVAALAVGPIVYFMGHWRAKQAAWTIELIRAGALAPAKAPGDGR